MYAYTVSPEKNYTSEKITLITIEIFKVHCFFYYLFWSQFNRAVMKFCIYGLFKCVKIPENNRKYVITMTCTLQYVLLMFKNSYFCRLDMKNFMCWFLTRVETWTNKIHTLRFWYHSIENHLKLSTMWNLLLDFSI